MKATRFVIKDTAGRGYLAVNANTAFDLPRNWTLKEKSAEKFPDFQSAVAYAQAFYRRGHVEIFQAKE